VLASVGQEAVSGKIEVHDETEFQAVEVLASITQGRQLRDDARVLGWKANREFKGKLILASSKSKPVALAGNLKVTVAGPMQAELVALQEAHDKWVREQIAKKKLDSQASLAAFVDESVPNLSCIVVLAEVGNKCMLLTGDARGDKILQGMELAGVLEKDGRMHVDVLKVPHHGSDNNMDTSFFDRVTADHYVFSGDGEHGNPERRTMEMLFDVRSNEAFTIHLTYPIEEIDAGRKEDWRKEQKKEKARQAKNPKATVRPDWSPKDHGLGAFESRGLANGQKIEIVDEKKAHVINLLDPLGF
jgi:hypothetical protein